MRAPLALAIALAPFAAATSVADLASAQLPLRVRAETRLELGIEPTDRGLALRGTLRDDLGEPLAGRRIDLAIAEGGAEAPARHVALSTDASGTFELDVEATGEAARETFVRAEFAGDAYHDGTEAARSVRPGLEDVHLALTLPNGGVFDLDARRHPITIVARTSSGPAHVRIELFDELGRRLGEGVASELGRLRVELTPSLLGPAGAGRLVARSTADRRHAASQTEVPIVRVRPTRLELGATPVEARPGERVALRGRLYGSDGARAREAVGIFADETHVGTVLTDHHGSFEIVAAMPATEAEAVAFSARYEPNGPGHAATASSPIFVRTLGPSPYRWAHRLLPPIALLLAWFAVRAARRGARRFAPTFLAPDRRSSRRDRPFAARTSMLGGVVLGENDAPLGGTRIAFRHSDGRSGEAIADSEGRFALGELAPGEVELRATIAAHAEATLRRTLPARPGDAEIVFRLRSLRAIALSAFRKTAEPWLDGPEAWPTTTNAQAAAKAPPVARADAEALAYDVDRIYYGPGPAEAEEVDRIARAAEEQRNDAELRHRPR